LRHAKILAGSARTPFMLRWRAFFPPVRGSVAASAPRRENRASFAEFPRAGRQPTFRERMTPVEGSNPA
jgi:hypothetical protein